jgi:acyl-CoA hydrolase
VIEVHARAALDQAVEAIKSGDTIFVHGANAYPQALVDALQRRDELENIEIIHLHTHGRAFYAQPEYADRIHHRALFVAANVRDAVDDGRASYVPIFLSDIPELFRSRKLDLDVALLHISPPDQHGYCSLGTSIDCALAAAQCARVRIAQINPQMPRTLGESFIHLRDIDYSVMVNEPLPEMDIPALSPVHQLIGQNVAELVPNGATLQIGIGGIPNAVLGALELHKDLGIHSEVISDGIVDLVEAGVVTGAHKTLNQGKVVAAFLNGTRRLYDFADDNPMVEMRPVDYTNNTGVIIRLDRMIAINSALEIDLTGQVCAESIGSRIYSGVGGQMDFMRGAALSKGGKPIIAMAATARGGSVSRIVPTLQPGAGITTTRAHIQYVVTEHGCENLHGMDLGERAQAMINLAAPEFRDDLQRAARDLHLVSN